MAPPSAASPRSSAGRLPSRMMSGLPWILLLAALLPLSSGRRSSTAAVRSHAASSRVMLSLPSRPSPAQLLPSRHESPLDCLTTLRGGAAGDQYASGNYGQEPSPARRGGNGGGYREDWEGPAAAGMRDRYSGGRRRTEQDNDDDEYYHDRGLPTPRERRHPPGRSAPAFVPAVLSRGNKKAGLVLLAAGAALTMLGVSLFFNKALMRLGNLLVIAGVPLTLGPSRTLGYFLQPAKARATACLAAGILLVFVGWPVFGIALELFGLLNLFGNMFPIFWAVAKQTPFVGNLLKRNEGGQTSSSRRRYYDDADDFERRRKEEERYY